MQQKNHILLMEKEYKVGDTKIYASDGTTELTKADLD